VEPAGRDLRVIVAGGRVVGCAERRARIGEWRTNVALGAHIEPGVADQVASDLAVEATGIVGLDLAGVDLIATAGGYVVIEVNAAVEFRPLYSQNDVFAAAMAALAERQLLVTP
jgi:glutathione synthase/RimK-type ligase-like ATP-grasp enzyme